LADRRSNKETEGNMYVGMDRHYVKLEYPRENGIPWEKPSPMGLH
jgi:hypothetical protein